MSAEIDIYNPEALGAPMGQYTHVTRVKASEFLFIAGMLSGDNKGNIIGEGDFDAQTAQVFRNIEAALREAPRPGAERKLSGKQEALLGGDGLFQASCRPCPLDAGAIGGRDGQAHRVRSYLP